MVNFCKFSKGVYFWTYFFLFTVINSSVGPQIGFFKFKLLNVYKTMKLYIDLYV